MRKQDISNSELNAAIHKIIREISKDGWKPDYIVGITRGGLVPALMISHYLDVSMEALKVSFRDDGYGPESNLWMAEDAYNGKNILVVDDINDTGATLNWIKQDWPSGCIPSDEKWNTVWNNNVRFAVVVDNQASKFHDVDYSGCEINKAENDVWINFPWEHWWE